MPTHVNRLPATTDSPLVAALVAVRSCEDTHW
ncbi:hypothetical protein FHU38_004632 [Saccharomonospora amisosensis]|uniref:Uncharacterized protein n=1 Tax=Saccharomonospora amisosensis TaxID=1128677 RepID=A0A7X5ZSU9_9PSEU|nr:hypothetical protein [Saccharomonospora amisosensis]